MSDHREKMRNALSIDWGKIDLNRHYKEIMAETGASEKTVRRARELAGIRAVLKRGPAKGGGKFQNIDPKTLDFNLTDAAIAEQLGCHSSTVQKMRLRAGILFGPRRRKV